MTISSSDALDTIQFLIPGFVLMKVFYFFGLRTQRSDAQWVLWSILATVPVAAIVKALMPIYAGPELPMSLAIAVAVGATLSAGWWLLARWQPELAFDAWTRAWDIVFGSRRWIQVETVDHQVFSGRSRFAARSVETDDLDLYLKEPRVVDTLAGTESELPGVDGILIARSQIAHIAVFTPVGRQ
jgi:Family of unknown function (DUF6338)